MGAELLVGEVVGQHRHASRCALFHRVKIQKKIFFPGREKTPMYGVDSLHVRRGHSRCDFIYAAGMYICSIENRIGLGCGGIE